MVTIRQAVDRRKKQMILEKYQKNLFVLALVVIVILLGYRDMYNRYQKEQYIIEYQNILSLCEKVEECNYQLIK